jgi:hypothetical protein
MENGKRLKQRRRHRDDPTAAEQIRSLKKARAGAPRHRGAARFPKDPKTYFLGLTPNYRLRSTAPLVSVCPAFMSFLPTPVRTVAVALALTAVAHAQSLLPPERVPLASLAAFRPVAANWQLAGGLAGDPRHDKMLAAAPGTGVLVCNPTPEARSQLLTTWEHADLELDLDFLLTPGSNSGVYLQGRYEVQLFDSWGVKAPTSADCGGIYQRWDDARGQGREGYEGVAPLANASHAPGLWQHLHIEFTAPRFDAAGKKTKNARFTKVVLNGFTVQDNVEVTGPTRSAAFADEKPFGPLMIQGDHGPVAIRAIEVKRFDPAARVAVENLGYKLYPGTFKAVGDYDQDRPAKAGVPAKFSHTAVEKTGKFALVFTGSFVVPRDGDYAFTATSNGTVRLLIDGHLVIAPTERGAEPGRIALTAGAHAFRFDDLHGSNGRPSLDLAVEGPGLAARSLMANDPRPPRPAAAARAREIPIEPVGNRVRLQRSFIPFEPKKRLYGINVGSPTGVNYSYDLETGTVLRAWRGGFLDARELWEGRAENQLTIPTGPGITFGGKPTVALIEFPLTGGWPEQADAMQSSQGYTLEPDGQPVFLSKLSDLTIRDRVAPMVEGPGLTRTLTLGGGLTSWSTWVLLAEGDTITPQPGGTGWIIGDREWYLDWPGGSALTPVIHTRNGKQQLVIRVTKQALGAPINYSLVW